MDGIEADELFAELEALKAEGKLRHYGIALGPKIGWRDEGVHALTERAGLTSLQTVYNLLEQAPGAEFLELAEALGVGVIARVPTSSGLLEGHLTPEHTFEGNDHRRHRPRSWLIEGLQKVDQLEFLTRGGERTLAQAAFKYVLAQPGHRLRRPHGQHRRPARGVGGRGHRGRCPTSTRTSWPASTSSTRPASGSARRPEPERAASVAAPSTRAPTSSRSASSTWPRRLPPRASRPSYTEDAVPPRPAPVGHLRGELRAAAVGDLADRAVTSRHCSSAAPRRGPARVVGIVARGARGRRSDVDPTASPREHARSRAR